MRRNVKFPSPTLWGVRSYCIQNKTTCIMASSEPLHIAVGAEFKSWNDFCEAKRLYQNENKQCFVIKDSRRLDTHPLKGANDECEYQYAQFVCKYGKNRHEVTEVYERETRTFKCNCESFIFVRLTNDYQKLYIKSVKLDHKGHDGSETFYKFLPEMRRLLTDEDRQYVIRLLSLGCSKGKIRDVIRNEKDVYLTSKDLHNLEQSLKECDENDLGKFAQQLKDELGMFWLAFFYPCLLH
ncbi:hypothetical protein QAD02_013854 [Eretmocerus hayati]|uniref:Uncharacterized protein n=1 Tax=Eretmocerus hayati TaxID=131215 RepID=A0ACC2P3W1_9HYME|nr:hypothetical protein QAD02_013854 [Eretmocerus hayati]